MTTCLLSKSTLRPFTGELPLQWPRSGKHTGFLAWEHCEKSHQKLLGLQAISSPGLPVSTTSKFTSRPHPRRDTLQNYWSWLRWPHQVSRDAENWWKMLPSPIRLQSDQRSLPWSHSKFKTKQVSLKFKRFYRPTRPSTCDLFRQWKCVQIRCWLAE